MDEPRRVEQVAAVVALIAAGVGVMAQVTLALDVAVGQEPSFRRSVPLRLLLAIQVAVVEQGGEDVL